MRSEKSYKGISAEEMKSFLDEKVELYNRPAFIETDPISIPHRFTGKEDIEISGFLAASIAWGRRDLILRSSERLLDIMANRPYEFIINAGKRLNMFLRIIREAEYSNITICYSFFK